ncbi:MAG: sulfite exporter TauE/SafE family protein [candidate division WOR-3 bacterium]|uniref:Sulfite exporter TauE/SafE family protein n=2 Tax=candidate division WOR-3 bacterium TaxID=2052148 RepID=A0A7C3IZT0_UNCW3|nr:sulfite exporter TauE/SafE family protein [candidate division WOR-3 bacterium]
MSPVFLVRAVMLGLSAGASCLGFCLPVVLPVLAGSDRPGFCPAAVRLSSFLAGRLLAYLLFGITAGLVGARLSRLIFLRTAALPVIYLLLGGLMIIYGMTAFDPFARLRFCRLIQPRLNSGRFLFLLGLLAGASPCPPFLLALATVLDDAGVLSGALFFLVFFLATSVYFLPLLFAGLAVRFEPVRVAARVVAIIAGAYFVLYSLAKLFIIR